MSCEDCEELQEDTDLVAYYRWKNANIAIRACKKHLIEIFEALDKVQERERKK